MPAWSFQPRFRRLLLNGLAECERRIPPYAEIGTKRQTIRRRRADGRDPRPGQEVNLWIAMRTPGRELLGETPPIMRETIDIDHAGAVRLGGIARLAPGSITRLARRDGFDEAAGLYEFIERVHGYPFAGYLFRW